MWEECFRDVAIHAARQHGLITGAQAARVGADAHMLARFSEFGLLDELDWSVYQVSGSSYDLMYALPYAAWLAISPESFRWERPGGLAHDAALSHESACALWEIGNVKSPVTRFVSTTERIAPRATRIVIAALDPADVVVHQGVPVTTPHRTILDLVAESAARDDISRVFSDAIRRDLVDLRRLFEDLLPIAGKYGLPSGGIHFVDYFMPGVPPSALSVRNLRTYAELVSPERVTETRLQIDRILAELRGDTEDSANARLSAEIAAEIVGRIS